MYDATEREAMLKAMREASNRFYAAAFHIGCHPFIEFTGLLNEYIKVCWRMHEAGEDFNDCSAHSGKALPLAIFEAAYLGEKLGCIYGPSLAEPERLRRFLGALGVKAPESPASPQAPHERRSEVGGAGASQED